MAELKLVTDADGATLIRVLNAVLVAGAGLLSLSVDRDGEIFRTRLSLDGLTLERAQNLGIRVKNSPLVRELTLNARSE